MQTKFQIFKGDRGKPAGDATRPAPAVGSLPATLTLTECAAAQLRAYLGANGLKAYHVFHAYSFGLNDINTLLPALGEGDCAWEMPPSQIHGGQPVSYLTYNETSAWEHASGFLRLYRHEAVLARWYWHGPAHGDGSMWLVATPSPETFASLRRAVLDARRESNRKRWQVLGEYGDGPRPPRELVGDLDALVLPDALRERISAEVLRFFQPEVAQMYRDLNVPYRRGVLMYGPPGNGKTSLIRWIGASLPQVAALSLRAWQGFDSDDLLDVIKQWTAQAPAMLVLEDLDWLLEQVNVSTFLNTLDGIVAPPNTEGLLLIATTNHPEKLDPAVNNRPGRFDSSIELPPPEAALRERFLRAKLPELGEQTLAEAVSQSEGLSFAHLQELLRLSGLRAINAGRRQRTADDVLTSLADLKGAHHAANSGFPSMRLDMPFGLGHLHKAK